MKKYFGLIVSICLATLGAGLIFWNYISFPSANYSSSVEKVATTPQKLTFDDWSLYTQSATSDRADMGTGDCGDYQFTKVLAQIATQPFKVLSLRGDLTIYATTNPANWSNETFLAYNENRKAICAVGGTYPLQAYSDKLLWVGSCGSGAVFSNADEQRANLCDAQMALVDSYFGIRPGNEYPQVDISGSSPQFVDAYLKLHSSMPESIEAGAYDAVQGWGSFTLVPVGNTSHSSMYPFLIDYRTRTAQKIADVPSLLHTLFSKTFFIEKSVTILGQTVQQYKSTGTGEAFRAVFFTRQGQDVLIVAKAQNESTMPSYIGAYDAFLKGLAPTVKQ